MTSPTPLRDRVFAVQGQIRGRVRTWMLENFTGRANVVIVAATSAILLPPEDPNA